MTGVEIQRFRRIEAIFDQALDRPAGPSREAWLRETCREDTALFDEVASFLLEHEALAAARVAVKAKMPRFGAWQAVRLLGRGGMGTVYLADRADGAFRMQAAVKLAPLALASIDIEERFRRERQFLASLDHPKIARLIDGGVTDHGIPWLAMEFIDGLPIDRFARERFLNARNCALLMRQLMEALIYIHGRQVVHRDLKPSNVLVDGNGQLKLIDFGTARLSDAGAGSAITQSGVFAFTPDYASPEQMAGRTVTFASDVYSAGLVLRKMLPEGKADRDLARIIDTGLQPNPHDRYSSAGEMDADLARYLGGEEVRASRTSRWRRSIPALACCAALCGAAGFAAWRHFRAAPEPPSIAVMPFGNLSSDPADRYFSEGLTDEITDSLAHFKNLRVIARSSASWAKARTKTIRDAGRALNVSNVLEGSVQRSGERVRIVAHLDRVSDGSVVWTATYERKASDLFPVQSELAASIASNLRVATGTMPARHNPKPEAYELAMQGRYDLQRMTPGSLSRAETELRHAIELDPEYAAAYGSLAAVKYDQGLARVVSDRSAAERESAERLARRALELEPDYPTARILLAILALQYDWDWSRAEAELRTAVAGSPSANAESQYAFLLAFRGRFAEADQHLRRAAELDPFATAILNNLAVCRFLEGRFPEVRSVEEKVLVEAPAMLYARELIGGAYIMEGHPELAMPIFLEMEKRAPEFRMLEATAQAAAGRREEALRLARPFEEKYPNLSLGMMYFANLYAVLGDEPNTLKWLGRSADRHEFRVLTIGVNPVFAKMRGTPGFRALEHRIGLE